MRSASSSAQRQDGATHRSWGMSPRASNLLKLVASLAALGGALMIAPAVDAQPSREVRPVPVPIASPRVDVLVHGAVRPVYWASGERFVEGRLGERYVIRIHNPTWRRVEAVVAVDGRDVIDGRPSSLRKRGYVISPHGYIDIDGFRLSGYEVAAFRFSSVEDSYAARMGTPWRVGVVDVALFPEREHRRYRAPVARPSDAESRGRSKGDSARPEASGLGTEFGERRVSPVRETSFERESWNQPTWRTTLRYDDSDGLCARGVRAMCPTRPPWPEPGPYAQPPPGWEDPRWDRRR